MNESTKPECVRKPLGRKAKVVRPIDAGGRGIIHLAVQKSANVWEAHDYGITLFVAEAPCGLGAELRRDDGEEPYHVLLAMDPAEDSCDCRGNQAHCHCKHVSGLRALLARGKLRIPSAVEAAALPVEQRLVDLNAVGNLPDRDDDGEDPAGTNARLSVADTFPASAYELAAA